MENVQITIDTILAFFGAVAVVAGGVKVIMQLLSPFKVLKDRITDCEERLDQHDVYLKNDKDSIAEIKTLSKENLRVNIALLNHFIDGNGVEGMKKLREELEDNLIDV